MAEDFLAKLRERDRAPDDSAPYQPQNIDPARSKPYAAAALKDECAQVAAVPIGAGRNDQLNRSAFKMGTLVAAGAIDEATVVEHLGAADGGLHYKATRDTIRSGIRAGMQSPRTIPERTELAPFESNDPLDPGYVEPVSTTGGETWGLPDGAPGVESTSAEELAELVRKHLPLIDWRELWQDETSEEWIIEPLLAARRQVAIYSAPKVGKSLLLLELAQSIARGVKVLGVQPDRPYRVLYVDFENDPRGDVRTRLQNMQVGPDDLDNLCYLSFPTLAALDSERGSTELLAAVKTYACEVVVIDTVSRAVQGDENENDTWLAFYRHTGLKLKQAGVAMIRLDHSGKDDSKGQRGGSAKSGDVDAVWKYARLTNASVDEPDEKFRLSNEATRMPIAAGDKLLTLIRRSNPLRHEVQPAGVRDSILDQTVAWLDENDVPLEYGVQRDGFLKRVKDAVGDGVSRAILLDAQKRRRQLAGVVTLEGDDE
uniref:AAA+ ATPase domain-containing protein n=1 Tax=uncultured organism TaxID=155900 RepID=A0A7L9QBS2_9ZZZZ|nr:hypothetical protein [uncultured organism]